MCLKSSSPQPSPRDRKVTLTSGKSKCQGYFSDITHQSAGITVYWISSENEFREKFNWANICGLHFPLAEKNKKVFLQWYCGKYHWAPAERAGLSPLSVVDWKLPRVKINLTISVPLSITSYERMVVMNSSGAPLLALLCNSQGFYSFLIHMLKARVIVWR